MKKNIKSLDNRSKLVWLMSTEDSTIINRSFIVRSTYEKRFIVEKNKMIRK